VEPPAGRSSVNAKVVAIKPPAVSLAVVPPMMLGFLLARGVPSSYWKNILISCAISAETLCIPNAGDDLRTRPP
jgi:hypothetical protein